MRFLAAVGAALCAVLCLFVAYGLTRPVPVGVNPAPVALVSLAVWVLAGAGMVLLLRRAMR
jgi:hypothetical protein